MQVPLEIRFHDVAPSDELERDIRVHAEKLNRIYDRLIACRVSVEAPHRQHRTGNVPEVHIELSVPGRDLVVSREPHKPGKKYADPSLKSVLRDSFRAAERQLKAFREKQRGEVKPQAEPMLAHVIRLVPEQDHGFIETSTGTQLYFNRTSVMDGTLDDLAVGESVHYIEILGDNGPIASKLWPAKGRPAQD